MPSNERENIRREKQRQKDKKSKRIIWIVLILVLAALLIMKVCEIDFSSLKDTVFSSAAVSKVAEDVYPYSLEAFDNAELNIVNNKLDILTNSSMVILNPNDAKQLYSVDHNYSNPIMSHAGGFICLIDQGGTRLRLDTTSDERFELNTEKRILTADVSSNGYVAYATLSEDAKSTICVISKSTQSKMKYDVNDGYVTEIAINSSGSKIAFVTVNSSDAKLTSTLHIMSVGADEESVSMVVDASNVLDLSYCGANDFYVVCDDALYFASSGKRLNKIFEKGSISTINYCYNESKELIINYGRYSDSIDNEIAYIRRNGKIKTTISFDNRVKDISAGSDKITVLLDDKVKIYSSSKGEEKSSYDCLTDTKAVHTLSSKHFVLHGQYIDVIE